MATNYTYRNRFDGVSNLYYFGIAAIANRHLSHVTVPEIVIPVHGGAAFVLLCNSTLYDIEYTSLNNTISSFTTTLSNSSVASMWQTPMSLTDIGQLSLEQSASLAAMSDTAEELAARMSFAYSSVALAVGSQVTSTSTAIAAQHRSSTLVTKVRPAALFTLIGANLLIVVVGLVLAVVAFTVVSGPSGTGSETYDIQTRLSVAGLVANQFEGLRASMGVEQLEQLFEEYDGRKEGVKRVIIDRVHSGGVDGYEYRITEGEHIELLPRQEL